MLGMQRESSANPGLFLHGPTWLKKAYTLWAHGDPKGMAWIYKKFCGKAFHNSDLV